MSKASTKELLATIRDYALVNQTPVSLRQMVKFGRSPNAGTLLRASQFLREELPIRLAHRVVELDKAPYGLSDMPSICRVKDWYAQSFKDLVDFPTPEQFGIDGKLLLDERQSSEQGFVPSSLETPLQPASNFLSEKKAADSGPLRSSESSAMRKMLFGQQQTRANLPSLDASDGEAIWNSESTKPDFKRNSEISFITASSAAPIKVAIPETSDTETLKRQASTLKKSFQRYYSPIKKAEFSSRLEEYNRLFVECIENVKKRHDPTMSTMALGVLEAKDYWKGVKHPLHQLDSSESHGKVFGDGRENVPLPEQLQHFLDRFYMSRIGIRMLIGQHIALIKDSKLSKSDRDYVGIICTKTKLHQVVQEAIDNARAVCQSHYGLFDSPTIRFVGGINTEFMYVPSHLHHMLFELLKNSLRAVVERFGIDYDDWPEIRLVAAEGKEDITIKISDEGGGIPRSGMPLVWTYMYTTANKPLVNQHQLENDYKAPLAGFGYGLPLARLYARYFGGDLRLISMESYGTDAYLHLNRLSDSEEPLP